MKTTLLSLLSICFFAVFAFAQTDDEVVKKTVLEKDALFWTGYNNCRYEQMGAYIADNVEFYHDKGGITRGKTGLVDSIKKNLCGNPNFRTRREAAPGTVQVFLLKNANAVYGAIVAGDHYFFNSYDGQPEKREGVAKFVNLWIYQDEAWVMSRILSFEHRPAPYENKRQAVNLPERALKRFAGRYVGARTGEATVTIENGRLSLRAGPRRFELSAETGELFFVTDRDLTFEFVSRKGKVTRMIIRENGEVVDEARR